MEKVAFIDPETEQEISFYILEETTIAGNHYLMVTVDEEGDSDAFILKAVGEDDSDATYEMVDDDKELQSIAKVFAELIDDVDLQF